MIEYHPGAACCVVLAAPGYPDSKLIKKGMKINGLIDAEHSPNVRVFHAGTKRLEDGSVATNGGRVLGVTGWSPNGIVAAQKIAYDAVDKITFEGGVQYRNDIAYQAVKA